MPEPVVPSLPPLSGIKDPQTRAAFQALYDQLRVRNGEVGTGENRFLTEKDLLAGVSAAARGVGSGGKRTGLSGYGSRGGVAGAIQAIVDKVTEEISGSWIYKQLKERLEWIETPDWFIGKFGAAIQQETTIRESQIQAQATFTNTAVANINSNIALAQDRITVMADDASALAEKVTTVQTEVGGVRVIAEDGLRVAQDAKGNITGSWSVKFDANGYVAGIGLGVEKKPNAPPQSKFIINVDQFAVAAPGATPYFPFTVNANPQPGDPAVVVNGDMVVNGTITAQKIANNAISRPMPGGSVTLAAGETAIIMLFGGANWLSSGGADYSLYVSISGSNPIGVSQQGGFSAGASTAAVFTVAGPGTFSYTLNRSVTTSDGSWGGTWLNGIAFLK